jgi:hypothetical protein
MPVKSVWWKCSRRFDRLLRQRFVEARSFDGRSRPSKHLWIDRIVHFDLCCADDLAHCFQRLARMGVLASPPGAGFSGTNESSPAWNAGLMFEREQSRPPTGRLRNSVERVSAGYLERDFQPPRQLAGLESSSGHTHRFTVGYSRPSRRWAGLFTARQISIRGSGPFTFALRN